MSSRIPPSTVSVRRIVSEILNIAIASQVQSMRLPQVQRTVSLGRGEFQKLPRCSHRGSVRPQALAKTGYTMRRPNQQKASCVRAPDLNECTTKTVF